MASPPYTISLILFSIFLFSFVSNAQITSLKPEAFTFPITKVGNNSINNQYYTTIHLGSNATALDVVIDIGGNFLWFNSDDYFNAAASYRPILCGTRQCRIANGVGCTFCYNSPPVPGCTNNTCSDYALDPYSGTRGYSGLGQDVLRVQSTRGGRYALNNFPFQFSDPVLRERMGGPAAGIISLGRTRISLQAQLASAFKIREKFALCLPSSSGSADGNLIVGETAYSSPFQEMVSSGSLFTTSLKRNPVSNSGSDLVGNLTLQYFINVKSIRVDSKTLSLNQTLLSIDKNDGSGGTSIRTVRPFTGLSRSIYKALVNEFVKAAKSKNIKQVNSVSPFGACFDSKTVTSTKTGPDVPTIELVLQKKSVYWRFYGSNSMVRVSKDVICLAFVEGKENSPGGSGPITSIEVGGYQMENYLLEFDVVSAKLRFSDSLLLHDTSCSKFGAS